MSGLAAEAEIVRVIGQHVSLSLAHKQEIAAEILAALATLATESAP